jgi:hypothetical protein
MTQLRYQRSELTLFYIVAIIADLKNLDLTLMGLLRGLWPNGAIKKVRDWEQMEKALSTRSPSSKCPRARVAKERVPRLERFLPAQVALPSAQDLKWVKLSTTMTMLRLGRIDKDSVILVA